MEVKALCMEIFKLFICYLIDSAGPFYTSQKRA